MCTFLFVNYVSLFTETCSLCRFHFIDVPLVEGKIFSHLFHFTFQKNCALAPRLATTRNGACNGGWKVFRWTPPIPGCRSVIITTANGKELFENPPLQILWAILVSWSRARMSEKWLLIFLTCLENGVLWGISRCLFFRLCAGRWVIVASFGWQVENIDPANAILVINDIFYFWLGNLIMSVTYTDKHLAAIPIICIALKVVACTQFCRKNLSRTDKKIEADCTTLLCE